MTKLVELMIKENLIEKEAIHKLVRARPPRKISFNNLLLDGAIDLEIVEKFLAEKIKKGIITIEHLEKIEGINIDPILEILGEELNIEVIDLEDTDVDISLFEKVPYNQLTKYQAIPIIETDLNVVFAFADPLDMGAKETLQRVFPRKPIVIKLAKSAQIRKKLFLLEVNDSVKTLTDEIRADLSNKQSSSINADEDSAILKLIDIILRSSVSSGASDIHIEATEKQCLVRERVDGMLRQSFTFDKDIFSPLSSRVKLLSGLDIAEKRKPQDGRFSTSVLNKDFDFRVSTLPTLFGESIVMRILDKSKVLIRLEDAGMSKLSYEKFSEAIKVPYGIVLVTGPTGSGKTTTLYGALNAIKDVKDKTITVEDPVEYQMNGIQQVQVNNKAGLGFAEALRSILRQDPDKVMIGEIRDQETLRIAIQAALTGHLVLSTLHTNDAISAVNRILDMGIESYLVSGALVGIQAQRLVRKICPHCKVKYNPPANLIKEILEFLPEEYTLYKGEGCKECLLTGYAGREMISEVLTITEEISRMIASGASKEDITLQAEEDGFVTMFQDGINKAIEGKTTIEECFRVARL